MGEVDQAAYRQRRQHLAERRRVPAMQPGRAGRRVLQEIALGGELGEQRPLLGDQRILPDAEPEARGVQPIDHGFGVGIARRVEAEGKARRRVLPGAAVEGDDVGGDAALAQALRGAEQFFGVAVVGLGEPGAEAPARRCRRPAGEPGIALEERRRIGARDQEQVERVVLDSERVAALRPGRMAERMGDVARRVHEQAPAARAPGERAVLVRRFGVDAERVLDPRAQQLAAPVQGSPLLAQPVDRLAAREPERHEPAIDRAGERRQPLRPAEMGIGRGGEQHLAAPLEAEAQRVALQHQPQVARAQDRSFGLDRGRIAGRHQHAVVGASRRAQRQTKDARCIGDRLERTRVGGTTQAARHALDRAELSHRRKRCPVRVERIDRHRIMPLPRLSLPTQPLAA